MKTKQKLLLFITYIIIVVVVVALNRAVKLNVPWDREIQQQQELLKYFCMIKKKNNRISEWQ